MHTMTSSNVPIGIFLYVKDTLNWYTEVTLKQNKHTNKTQQKMMYLLQLLHVGYVVMHQ